MLRKGCLSPETIEDPIWRHGVQSRPHNFGILHEHSRELFGHPKISIILSVSTIRCRRADLHIRRSIDPEATKAPVGSNLATKTSPACPVSSMIGAWRPPTRGTFHRMSACPFQFGALV